MWFRSYTRSSGIPVLRDVKAEGGWLNGSRACGASEAGGSSGWNTGALWLEHSILLLFSPHASVYFAFCQLMGEQSALLWWWQQEPEQPHAAPSHPCRLQLRNTALLPKAVVKGRAVCLKLNCWADLKGLSSCQFVLWDFTSLMCFGKKTSF